MRFRNTLNRAVDVLILALIGLGIVTAAGCLDREGVARDRDAAVELDSAIAVQEAELQAAAETYQANGEPVPDSIAAGLDAARLTRDKLGEFITTADAILATLPPDAGELETGGAILQGVAPMTPPPVMPYLVIGGLALSTLGAFFKMRSERGHFVRVVGGVEKVAGKNGGKLDFTDPQTRTDLKIEFGTATRAKVNKAKGVG